MGDRARRAGKGPSSARNALAELAELRKSGKSRLETYEVKEEAKVYDEVDEDEYGMLVNKRREEGGETVFLTQVMLTQWMLPAVLSLGPQLQGILWWMTMGWGMWMLERKRTGQLTQS